MAWVRSSRRRILPVTVFGSSGSSIGDFDLAVLSHLHFDHTGNAQTLKESGVRLICNQKELDGATGFAGDFLGAHIKGDYQGLP